MKSFQNIFPALRTIHYHESHKKKDNKKNIEYGLFNFR